MTSGAGPRSAGPGNAAPAPAANTGQVPGYVYVITVLTGMYVIVELSFNARLLDVVGGASPPDVVHSIEYWGRCISGTALALAVWGMGIMPTAHRRHWRLPITLLLLVLSAAASGLAMWHLQKAIVDSFVDRSSGSERRVAMKLNLVERNAVLGVWHLKDIDLTDAMVQSPQGKSFLALMPFMASSFDGVEDKIDANLLGSIQSQVAMEYGGPQAFYASAFTQSVNRVYKNYKSYAEGYNQRQDAIAAIPERTQAAWRNYLAMLARDGLTPQSVPRARWTGVATWVRNSGVPVPPDWEPNDKAGFSEAVQRSTRAAADTAYAARARLPNGQPIPDGLSLQAFEALPGIQQEWHEALNLPGRAMLSHSLNGAAFVDAVFNPIVREAASREMSSLRRPDADYADGGPEQGHGRDAMALLVVPPIALAFSLAGALAHLFKITNYLARIAVGRMGSPLRISPTPVIATLVIAIALSAFLVGNDVTGSELFAFQQREMSGKGQAVPAVVCRWVIQAQPYFWPVNEWIRVHVLQGFAF
jgi:hypothetical protein